MAGTREPRLVLRFAAASLVAFVLVGGVGMLLMNRYAREDAESEGAYHARYVTEAVLRPALESVDLSEPMRGETYDAARRLVLERVLSDGRTIRVKIFRQDGTIVFSDEPALVGRRSAEEAAEIEELAEGAIKSGVEDLKREDHEFERYLGDKLFFTFVPLRTEPGGSVVAWAEIYQDYAFIQEEYDAVVARLALILVAGLAILYPLLLPIAVRASRELRRRNERLREHLEREQQTVEELRNLNQKKDDFVAAASHELRSPLTSIIGSLATLKRFDLDGDPAVRAEFLDAAERQTKRLERLITNMLFAAQIEHARPVERDSTDLGSITRSVAEELEAVERVRIDVPQPLVITDPARISKVLTHLLDNALKYSPEDSPVEVGASVGGDVFRLWVTDQGKGIDPADQDLIFERFHQVDQSATRRHGGLGLGLYLAKDLVAKLGGRSEVASAPGGGSTFTVAIPSGVVSTTSTESVPAPSR